MVIQIERGGSFFLEEESFLSQFERLRTRTLVSQDDPRKKYELRKGNRTCLALCFTLTLPWNREQKHENISETSDSSHIPKPHDCLEPWVRRSTGNCIDAGPYLWIGNNKKASERGLFVLSILHRHIRSCGNPFFSIFKYFLFPNWNICLNGIDNVLTRFKAIASVRS